MDTLLIHPAPMAGRRARGWSTSCSSTTSQSSISSIYPKITQSPTLVEPTEGLANVFGSFTTTAPATLWLRTHLKLQIPTPGIRRSKQRAVAYGLDSPPDSPLSLFQSLAGSRRSPSISRTMTDADWPGPSSSPSLSLESDSDSPKLHPILKAVEKSSKLSYKTVCSACKKVGANYPRCPRCHEMWCSRACRLQGGKKHRCPVRGM